MCFWIISGVQVAQAQTGQFFSAYDSRLNYMGRADYSDTAGPKFWASGASLSFEYEGTEAEVVIGDEVIYGSVHNYIEVQIDDQPSYRLQLTQAENRIKLVAGLKGKKHRVSLVKNTEFENGYIQFKGVYCKQLLTAPKNHKRKIEFIGDSITCGFGADEQHLSCKDPKSEWYDQHSAYYAYGPRTARALKAQYHLSAVSGIGLLKSCCEKPIIMPQVYDKVNMAQNKMAWDFNLFQPDVLTICLGQNDGIQDSAQFVSAYITFIQTLKTYYPSAKIMLLTSPMADSALKEFQMKALKATVQQMHKLGFSDLAYYAFKLRAISGCSSHPSKAEHALIAAELQASLKRFMNW